MDRSRYPALASSRIIHLDASAAFPIHEEVISAVNGAMEQLLGAPGKAHYQSAIDASKQVESMRERIANFINADLEEIYIVASATDAARYIADLWADGATTLYSPEDHSRIVYEISRKSKELSPVPYSASGEYDYKAISGAPDLAVVSQLHHVYGSENNITTIRKLLPNIKLVVDASQSASRMRIDVKKMECDALFFSSQKIGGVAGVGILYIAKKHRPAQKLKHIEPNTIPVIPLISLSSAIAVLENESMSNITQQLAKMTSKFIADLSQSPSIEFTKGPAFPEYACYGSGIVSFSVHNYTSQDVAMILADNNINVRAGDHCVSPTEANQDVVRVSMHMYTTDKDIDTLVAILKKL